MDLGNNFWMNSKNQVLSDKHRDKPNCKQYILTFAVISILFECFEQDSDIFQRPAQVILNEPHISSEQKVSFIKMSKNSECGKMNRIQSQNNFSVPLFWK